MCLGLPGQVIAIDGLVATVDFWGVRKSVRLDEVAEPIVAGDYIIDHAGHAVRRIAPADVNETLALYEVILTEAGCDPIAIDSLETVDQLEIDAVLVG